MHRLTHAAVTAAALGIAPAIGEAGAAEQRPPNAQAVLEMAAGTAHDRLTDARPVALSPELGSILKVLVDGLGPSEADLQRIWLSAVAGVPPEAKQAMRRRARSRIGWGTA